MKSQLEEIEKRHQHLKERLLKVSPPERLRRLEIFLPDYVEAVQEVKRQFDRTPAEVTEAIERMAQSIVAEVKYYYDNVNKNHTVKMNDVIAQVGIMINGLHVSDKLKAEIESQSASNDWHGH